ncbi:uncharacterized protein LOC108195613 [Daucus carota subsp. sativus]|uniref:uncharacterized protein LOC108195613 n=1 Tax=Daucus carota subsp. sativus TaxID=79200 RepID=UPI003083B022
MIQHNAWRPQRQLPKRSVSVLRAWLFEQFLHPYPKDSDKHMLAKQTILSRSQIPALIFPKPGTTTQKIKDGRHACMMHLHISFLRFLTKLLTEDLLRLFVRPKKIVFGFPEGKSSWSPSHCFSVWRSTRRQQGL